MRNTLILAAAFATIALPALAQSSPAQPVMPAPREDGAPAPMATPSSPGAAIPEGRAAAPNAPVGQTAPNGNARDKARSGANGS